jgi:cysteine synthase
MLAVRSMLAPAARLTRAFVSKAEVLDRIVETMKQRDIVLPTFDELINPEKVPAGIKEELKDVDLWGLVPRNLFRITWKNEPVASGGGFGGVNYIELPPELTGVRARLFVLLGKYFPTGAHKVGATYGPLVSRLVDGSFDPTYHLALWPSTGNYCRGGAYDSYLLGIKPVAVLPEEMSAERFQWLREIGAEVHATPGCESNVKEVFDKSAELDRTRDEIIVMNQFCDFTNPLFHYHVTGRAMREVFEENAGPESRFAGVHLTQGSAGTLASADYLKTEFPHLKLGVGEALQCPTLLHNGYGGHRIEGIGDKHVPWIHNTRNTDAVVAVDDQQPMDMLRLFNEPAGREVLREQGVKDELIEQLDLLGISSLCNLAAAIKTAKYYDMDGRDVLYLPLTDSLELYGSRIRELEEEHGPYGRDDAQRHLSRWIQGCTPDHMRELNYHERKQLHNFKYFTWVEQQQRDVNELRRLWDRDFWPEMYAEADLWDDAIRNFNEMVGLG